MESNSLVRLPELLLPWYRENRRQLPWRADRDPYHIWISEIMLQQTRVEAVKGYYSRFLSALPSLEALAKCDDELLHKLWEGLGYYSRVRNLKKAAGEILQTYGGVFPRTYEEILSLPGIGEYTAGAVCSIAYDLPTPAVDGNVLRVLSRLRNDATPIDLPETKREVRTLLETIYPKEAGDFTQALMELGATLCGPNRLPEEDRTVFILRCGDVYALEKRPPKGLLAGLWQFPNISGHPDTAGCLAAVEAMGLRPRELKREVLRRHIFTHIVWNMKGIYLDVADPSGKFRWFTDKEINEQAALPTAFRQFWEELDHV